MTVSLFCTLVVASSVVASLLTESIKTVFKNAGKEVSPNVIVIILSLLIGGVGTSVVYIVLNIPFNTINILAIAGMIFVNFLGSTLGYDKIIQTINQIKGINDADISKEE